MAAQGERELGDIVMGEGMLGPMVQDISEQEIVGVEGEQPIPPQMDPEPEMGAAAAEAAVDDTSPSPPYQNPLPIPAETVRQREFEMFLQAINRMNEKMEVKMDRMENNIMQTMDAHTQAFMSDARELRGEMRQVGQCLQAGKRATPSAATNELKGSAPAGEDREIRETCWTRHEVTEEKKLNGVTETCTAGREVTELTEIGKIEERLHGTEEEEDTHTHAHTHTFSDGQWGKARRACGDPVRAAGCPPSGMRGGSMPP